MEKLSGQCLCGSVKFTVTPSSNEVGVCHCTMCRRWAAGPYLGVACESDISFASDDGLTFFTSSDWGERGFCQKCGTSLMWRTRDQQMLVVSTAAFEDLENDLVLDHEIFIDEKPDYYDFAQETQKMTGAQVVEMFTTPEGERN